MDDTFLMGTTSSITVQSLGKIVQRAPAVGAKMWCLYVFCIFFVTLQGRRAVRSRVYIFSWFCVAVYGLIFLPFQRFFSQRIVLSDGLDSSHFLRYMAP